MSKDAKVRVNFFLGSEQAELLATAVTTLARMKGERTSQLEPEGRRCDCCGAFLSQYNHGRICRPCQAGQSHRPKLIAV